MPYSAVERAVKLVTDSTQNVCGSFSREGYKSEQNSTPWMNVPKFNTKKRFNVPDIVKKSQQINVVIIKNFRNVEKLIFIEY